MTADRMERVLEKARETAEDYFPSHDQFGFAIEGASDGQRGYIDGAVFGADTFRTLDDTEWTAMREKVAREIWAANEWDRSARHGNAIKPWEWLTNEGKAATRRISEAAMRAVGLRREGK